MARDLTLADDSAGVGGGRDLTLDQPTKEPSYMQRFGTALKERGKEAGTSALHTVEEMGRSLLPPPLRDKFQPKATSGELLSTAGNMLFPGVSAGSALLGSAGKATNIPGAETAGDIAGGFAGGMATSAPARNAVRSTGSLITRGKNALRTPIRESTIAKVPESIANLPKADYTTLEKQIASTPDVAQIFQEASDAAKYGPPGVKPSTKKLLDYYRANFQARTATEGPDLLGRKLMDAEQRLGREIERYATPNTAGYDPQTAHFLRGVRSQLIEQLDGLGGANQAYARQKTLEELTSIARKSANPGVEIRDRLATDPHLKKLFMPQQQRDLTSWMDAAGRVAPGRTRGKQIADIAKGIGAMLGFGYLARETGLFWPRHGSGY